MKAKIIADSIAPHGKRITTFELEFPRFILAEYNTHRMLSRNVASSRAIPIEKVIEGVQNNPAMPVWWGKNQSGMQAKDELSDTIILDPYGISEKNAAKATWLEARDEAIKFAKKLSKIGLHKQIVNRILEPWVNVKMVTTATDWDNFFHLRNHSDAQPEFHFLASLMAEEYLQSEPNQLIHGQWHIPYIETVFNPPHDTYFDLREIKYFVGEEEVDLYTALKVSASLCAQVSYRKSDDSIEKALRVYDRLVTSKPVHASPFEHQATPSLEYDHISGNFRGWIQYRHTISGNTCYKYDFGDAR